MEKIYVLRDNDPFCPILGIFESEDKIGRNEREECVVEVWQKAADGFQHVSTQNAELMWINKQGRTLKIHVQNKRKYTVDGINYIVDRSHTDTQISVDDEDDPRNITFWLLGDGTYDDVISQERPLREVIDKIIADKTPVCVGDDSTVYANFAHVEVIE